MLWICGLGCVPGGQRTGWREKGERDGEHRTLGEDQLPEWEGERERDGGREREREVPSYNVPHSTYHFIESHCRMKYEHVLLLLLGG